MLRAMVYIWLACAVGGALNVAVWVWILIDTIRHPHSYRVPSFKEWSNRQ